MILDIILGGIIGIEAIRGIKKGGIKELMGMVGVGVGILLGLRYYWWVGELLGWRKGFLWNILGFLIIFVGVILVTVIIRGVTMSVINLLNIGIVDRVCGGVSGVIKGGIIVVIICVVLSLSRWGEKIVLSSRIGNKVFYYLHWIKKIEPKLEKKKLPVCLGSSVVEHILGKDGVVGSIPIPG